MSEERHLLGPTIGRCPACAADALEPVVERDGGEVHFLCRACDRCWQLELGYVHRMNPETCGGCPEQARCASTYASDHSA